MFTIFTWLMQNQHWMVSLGVLLAILGTLYGAYGSLGKYRSFLHGLTHSLTLSIVGGLLVGPPLGGVALVFEGLQDLCAVLFPRLMSPETLRYLGLGGWHAHSLWETCKVVGFFFAIGLCIGMIVGFFIGLRLYYMQHHSSAPKLKRLFLWISATFMLTIIMQAFLGLDSALLMAAIGGSLIGVTTSHLWALPLFNFKSNQENALINMLLCGAGMLVVLFLLEVIFAPLIIAGWGPLDLLFSTLISGLLFGSLLNLPPARLSKQTGPSWRQFVLWVVIGFVFGFVLAMVGMQLVGLHFAETGFQLGFIIGVVNGQGEALIRQPKMHYRLSNTLHTKQPLLNKDRFIRGSLIGGIYGLCMFLIIIGFSSLVITNYFPAYLIELSVATLWLSIMGAVSSGLVVGGIHGWGPFLTFKVSNLTEQQIGIIGALIAIIGILVAALPSMLV